MLVSFTQTYGSGRDELFGIYFRDKRLIEFKNHFDHNIYSFHNCEQSLIDNFKKHNTIKNSIKIKPTFTEIKANPLSRSALLRAFQVS